MGNTLVTCNWWWLDIKGTWSSLFFDWDCFHHWNSFWMFDLKTKHWILSSWNESTGWAKKNSLAVVDILLANNALTQFFFSPLYT